MPTRDDVLLAAETRSIELRLPEVLMVALGVAESNLDPLARRPRDPSQDASYWPDVSMGAWQQTVRFSQEFATLCATMGLDPNRFPGPSVIEEIGDQFYDVWLASWWASRKILEHLWQSDPWQDRSTWNPKACTDEMLVAAMCRYNYPGGAGWSPNIENYRRGLAEAYGILDLSSPHDNLPPTSSGLDRETPLLVQPNDWACSIYSAAMAANAAGAAYTPAYFEQRMLETGRVTSRWGLMDADGDGLVLTLEEIGIPSRVVRKSDESLLTFQEVAEALSDGVAMMGGRGYNHWVFLRGYDPDRDVIRLGNPAPNWYGIGQEMDRGEFERIIDPVDLVVIEERGTPLAEIDELRAQLGQTEAWGRQLELERDDKDRRLMEVVGMLGYCSGQVADRLDTETRRSNVRKTVVRAEVAELRRNRPPS